MRAEELTELSTDRVVLFLNQLAAEPVSDVQRIGHSEWSRAFQFRRGEHEYVVRFSATDEDFLKDQRLQRHASARLPMPKLIEIGQAFDGIYAISERAFGEFLENRDEAAMLRVLPSLFRTLDAIREVSVADTTGFGLLRGDGSAPYATWRVSSATALQPARPFDVPQASGVPL